MIETHTKYTFADDHVFCSVLSRDKQLCMDLIALLLDVRVKDITYLNSQQQIEGDYDGRGIRLDVYVEDSDAVFDLEMQTVLNRNLAKRSRYYQSLIDQGLIEKGEDYSKLRKSYIVFICLEDPFQHNLSRYSFRKRCEEVDSLTLGDGTKTVFLNASGSRCGISPELGSFLDYLLTQKAADDLTGRIDKQVEITTSDAIWRKEHMTLEMKFKEIRDMTRIEVFNNLVKDGTLTVEQAAEKAEMSVSDFIGEAKEIEKHKKPENTDL